MVSYIVCVYTITDKLQASAYGHLYLLSSSARFLSSSRDCLHKCEC